MQIRLLPPAHFIYDLNKKTIYTLPSRWFLDGSISKTTLNFLIYIIKIYYNFSPSQIFLHPIKNLHTRLQSLHTPCAFRARTRQ